MNAFVLYLYKLSLERQQWILGRRTRCDGEEVEQKFFYCIFVCSF